MRNLTRTEWEDFSASFQIPATPLKDSEVKVLERVLSRSFTLHSTYREIRDIYVRRWAEIVFAAGAAKKAFNDAKLAGELSKNPGTFIPRRINSGFFGYDSWWNMPSLTAGQLNYWIDDTTPDNLSDSGYNEITVGRPAVHLILYVRSYAKSPSVEIIEFTKNGSKLPAVDTTEEFYGSELKIKELDTPILLVGGTQNDKFKARVFTGYGTSDVLALCGVSFLTRKAASIYDPAEMAGSSIEYIVMQ